MCVSGCPFLISGDTSWLSFLVLRLPPAFFSVLQHTVSLPLHPLDWQCNMHGRSGIAFSVGTHCRHMEGFSTDGMDRCYIGDTDFDRPSLSTEHTCVDKCFAPGTIVRFRRSFSDTYCVLVNFLSGFQPKLAWNTALLQLPSYPIMWFGSFSPPADCDRIHIIIFLLQR